MDETDSASGTVKSAATLLSVVEAIRELDGGGVTELADHLDIGKSTVHRHLSTLQAHDYVVKEADEYHLGLRLLGLGEYVRERNRTYAMARPVVDQLAEETEERALFMTEEHGRAVYLYRSVGTHGVRTNSTTGTRRYLHTIAGGKAILAHLPAKRVDEIVDRWGLPPETQSTITDREQLATELERIRECGVAFNREECIEGLQAVATPVLAPDGTVVGALSVSGPAHRIKGEWLEDGIPDLLLGSANELELNLKYAPESST
ncbi:IclR family transcriptional regulator [Salinirubellus salinus]|uniref:IclR family transcriptional regulator n=1 Tax=Salinirubellus salinus TaxID=1364945 RepID=A0A9E7R2X7_9EURY|nr:IclR family transcriptional regulator [Salinirubellus salinus]UWM54478.1 IclR family transcriptional regulator [Salinirubellus salinus]